MSDVPDNVHALLRAHVSSFEQLEILLLMKHCAGQALSGTAIAQRTNISVEIVWDALATLHASGLITVDMQGTNHSVRYSAATDALRDAVDNLTRAYDENRAAIMSIMSTNAIERVRSGALRTFSDAFVIRKKDSEDG